MIMCEGPWTGSGPEIHTSGARPTFRSNLCPCTSTSDLIDAPVLIPVPRSIRALDKDGRHRTEMLSTFTPRPAPSAVPYQPRFFSLAKITTCN
jgi:hypothetical protein